jgi:hypothetical protein
LLHEFLGIGSDFFAGPRGSFTEGVGPEIHSRDGVEGSNDIRFLLGLSQRLIQTVDAREIEPR